MADGRKRVNLLIGLLIATLAVASVLMLVSFFFAP